MTRHYRRLAGALIGVATVAALSTPALAAPAMAAGKVLELAGSVRVNGHPVKVGSPVRKGDTIETGANSRATVKLADGSAIRITFSTRVMINEMNPGTSYLSLLSGGLLSLVRKRSKFMVTSPQVIAAVHGTVFYIESSSAKPNYACICQGSVDLASTGKGAQHRVITTRTHTAFLVDPKHFGASTMWGHTDADVAGLRKYVP